MNKYGVWMLSLVAVLMNGCQAQRPAASSTVNEGTVQLKALRPSALEIVKASLKHKNPRLRSNAIEVVAQTGQKDLMPEIVRLMDDPVAAVRFSAIMVAGDMQCRHCEKKMRGYLKDADENVRLAAAYGLVKLNYTEFRSHLHQAVTSSDQTVRANAGLLIGKLGDPADIGLLYSMMRDESSNDMVKLQAVESIAQLKDIRLYRSKLWALLISKYADDRMVGIRGMGALGTVDAKSAIVTMLSDDVEEVRLGAAQELGKLGDKSGRDEVAGFFAKSPNLDETSIANQLAIMAIGRIGTPELTAYLPKALTCKSDLSRLAAAEAVLLLTK